MGFLQFTQMTESPGHLITVSFNVTSAIVLGSQDICDITSYRGLFCYTNYHKWVQRYIFFGMKKPFLTKSLQKMLLLGRFLQINLAARTNFTTFARFK